MSTLDNNNMRRCVKAVKSRTHRLVNICFRCGHKWVRFKMSVAYRTENATIDVQLLVNLIVSSRSFADCRIWKFEERENIDGIESNRMANAHRQTITITTI